MLTGYAVLPDGTGWKMVRDALAAFYDLGLRLYQSGTLGKFVIYALMILVVSLIVAWIRHLFMRYGRR